MVTEVGKPTFIKVNLFLSLLQVELIRDLVVYR